jgi:two-component system cell cycle response regulator PopA
VIGCTAFEAGAGRTPFVVGFEIGAAEVTSPEMVGRALESAASAANALKTA